MWHAYAWFNRVGGISLLYESSIGITCGGYCIWPRLGATMRVLQILAIAAVLFLFPTGVSAAFSEGVEYPMCGDMNLFFWNDSSDLGPSYNKLSTMPQKEAAKILSATTSSSTVAQTVGSFVTEPFPDGKVLMPGLTCYRVYLNVSSAVGITTFDFIPYNVSADGLTETRMFFGVPMTLDVNDNQVASEYLVSYARRNYTYFLPGERLLIRANISTTSTAPRTGYLNIAGTNAASMVSVGYWACASSDKAVASSIGSTGPKAVPIAVAIPIFAIMGAVVIARRKNI